MENKLGLRIKERLKAMNKNQTWLAERAGVTPSQISLIIRGKRGASIELLANIAEALGDSHELYIKLYTGRVTVGVKSPIREWIERSLDRLPEEQLRREAIYLQELADSLTGKQDNHANTSPLPSEGK